MPLAALFIDSYLAIETHLLGVFVLVGAGQAQPRVRDPLEKAEESQEPPKPPTSTSLPSETASGLAPTLDDQLRQKRKKA